MMMRQVLKNAIVNGTQVNRIKPTYYRGFFEFGNLVSGQPFINKTAHQPTFALHHLIQGAKVLR